jgi:2-hydroxycyclohexanecarboxyl-CoA dehydrogenase
MNLQDRIAVVSGAASGIGFATAKTLAQAGAYVFLGDIAREKGEAAAARLRGEGNEAEFLPLDVTDDEAVAGFAEGVLRRKGRIDIVVNAAGWGKIQPFVENTPDFWQTVVDLNFMGPVKVTRALLPKMIEQRSGKIVNIASDAGRVGSGGETVYSGAKGGNIAFTKALAREVARFSINVNCVSPGPTDTPLLAAVPEKHREAFQHATPFRRFAKPSEVADAVLFFASSRSDFITGQVLSVSGGLTMAG